MESGVSSSGVDFTTLEQLYLDVREAKREDIGAMAHIFIKSNIHNKTSQLLYNHDDIWPEVVEMLRNYLADDYTTALLAWDSYTDTTVGWTSVSLVTSDEDDYFKFCDSTVWAGRQLLRKETLSRGHTPLHIDQMKRASLITELRNRNRDGQNRHTDRDRLVINTVAIHPDIRNSEIFETAHYLVDRARDLAKKERLHLWAQAPLGSMSDPWHIFEEIGFTRVGSFELNLNSYANEEQRRRGNWGFQKWDQWVLQIGNWERGQHY